MLLIEGSETVKCGFIGLGEVALQDLREGFDGELLAEKERESAGDEEQRLSTRLTAVRNL